jgi:ribose transport system ATP-binding protein
MDEPTSSLTQVDTENLFRVLRGLRDHGVSIIYISHFLEECRQICDRYTVLRDGGTVATGNMATTDLREIIRCMVGREIQEIYPRKPHTFGAPILEVHDLAGKTKPRRVDFTLRAGEIFGIAGLIGAGRTETVRTCFGLDRVAGGTIAVRGRLSTRANAHQRLDQGVAMLSEDRKAEGLLLQRSIADNLTLTRLKPLALCGVLRGRRQRDTARHFINRLGIRCDGPTQSVEQLSGGNQQKVAVGRLLHHDAKVLLLDEPTRGIDVGSKAQIYQWMNDLAAEGRAIFFVSSYVPELLGICDTIGVMCRGVLTEVRPASDWTEADIIHAAVGQSRACAA